MGALTEPMLWEGLHLSTPPILGGSAVSLSVPALGAVNTWLTWGLLVLDACPVLGDGLLLDTCPAWGYYPPLCLLHKQELPSKVAVAPRQTSDSQEEGTLLPTVAHSPMFTFPENLCSQASPS